MFEPLELCVQGALPIAELVRELLAVAVFTRMFELVERSIFSIEELSVAMQEVIVDWLSHDGPSPSPMASGAPYWP